MTVMTQSMADLDTLMTKHQQVVATTPRLMQMISHSTTADAKMDDSWKKMLNIRVIARFRPPNSLELEQQRKNNLSDLPPDIQGNSITFTNISEKNGQKSKYRSQLDHIFLPNSTQKGVFKIIGEPLIEAGLGGFNATLFAYGQTGSGKTYSTFGAEDNGSGSDVNSMGIIPRSLVYIFRRLEQKCSNASIAKWTVHIQLLQIYNKQLLDLLNPNSQIKLKIKNDFDTNTVFVEHLTKIEIKNAREALACIIEASSNRITASHNLNAHSSRSHMLVLLKVKQIKEDGSSISSSINFGDLAGSENISKAHGKSDKGKDEDERRKANEKRKEGIAINASLSALTRCIHSLVNGKHPGYRDSPLTYLLQDSLGGNSKTTLLVCASPHIYNRSETVRTLRFAATAKNVENKAHVNQTLSLKALKERIKKLESENAKLKKLLKKKGWKKNKQESLKNVIGKRLSLFPSKVSLKNNYKRNEKNKIGNNKKGKGKGNVKGKGKKKGKKRYNNLGEYKNDGNDNDEYDTDDTDDDEIVEEKKSCWAYMFYCGEDDDDDIDEELEMEREND